MCLVLVRPVQHVLFRRLHHSRLSGAGVMHWMGGAKGRRAAQWRSLKIHRRARFLWPGHWLFVILSSQFLRLVRWLFDVPIGLRLWVLPSHPVAVCGFLCFFWQSYWPKVGLCRCKQPSVHSVNEGDYIRMLAQCRLGGCHNGKNPSEVGPQNFFRNHVSAIQLCQIGLMLGYNPA